MIEGIDVSGWPVWVTVTLLTLIVFREPLAKSMPQLFGWLSRYGAAKLDAEKYEREREAWREDKAFDLLEGALDQLRQQQDALQLHLEQSKKDSFRMWKTLDNMEAAIRNQNGILYEIHEALRSAIIHTNGNGAKND